MCLGEVAQVVTVEEDRATVRTTQRELAISLLTLDGPVAPGDWVLVHSGLALSRLTAEAASEALRLRAHSLEPVQPSREEIS